MKKSGIIFLIIIMINHTNNNLHCYNNITDSNQNNNIRNMIYLK